MSDTASSTRITSIGRVMVPAGDQDAAIEFYTQKLGFELLADVPYGDGERWVEVAPAGGGGTALALTPPRDAFQPGANTNIALTTRDIDAAHAELKEAGVDVDEEVSRFGGPVPPMFWLRDQDANTLLLVEDSGQQ
jgi:catechol 2,3-dioxygenase-like lactoylglutathione lyase family enzyme